MYNTNLKIVDPILYWYNNEKRYLPFRLTKNPYKIWLSEIMLQQTQVKIAIPYYKRWLKYFPNIKSVAKTDLNSLLKLWEGLGYYNRCRNFYRAAKIVENKFGGVIPDDWENFISLPGVGEYTSAAVLSIAFNKPYSVLDGNVKRVMCRILGIKNFTINNKVRIKKNLNKMIPKDRPGDFNQSLMELGALVCTPKNPSCAVCPIKSFCMAYKKGNPQNFPEPIINKKPPHYVVVAGLIWRKNRFYIQKRKNTNMLPGLWEFPGGKVKNTETLKEALNREIKEECGISPLIKNKIAAIEHSYSHYTITLHLYHCKEKNKIKKQIDTKWITPSEIDEIPFPKANHKLFSILHEKNWNN